MSIAVFIPASRTGPDERSTGDLLRHELVAFRDRQVWLTLAIAVLGGGGLFATFSYITPMMTHLAHYTEGEVTWLLVLFGLGMTAGNLLGSRFADKALMPTMYGAFVAEIVVALLFLATAHNKICAAIAIFALPAAALAGMPSQSLRMINLSGGAPNLAAASTQAAFNTANSLGAWLGGVVIAEGYGYDAPNAVAASLAAVGLCVAVFSGRLDRRSLPRRR